VTTFLRKDDPDRAHSRSNTSKTWKASQSKLYDASRLISRERWCSESVHTRSLKIHWYRPPVESLYGTASTNCFRLVVRYLSLSVKRWKSKLC
jgi:hypothetical protein